MAEEKKINIQKIYLKDASVESPQSPQIFSAESQQAGAPQVDVRFNIGHTILSEEIVDITLTLTVEATREDSNVYLIEIVQAGIFSIVGFEQHEQHHIMGAYAPEVLFPYARENVDSLLVKAGFPPLAMGPVNFEQFYRQNLQNQLEAVQEAKKEASGESDSTSTTIN